MSWERFEIAPAGNLKAGLMKTRRLVAELVVPAPGESSQILGKALSSWGQHPDLEKGTQTMGNGTQLLGKAHRS